MNSLWSDLRYGARNLRKSPVFTVVAVLMLAVGIGANAVVFAVVNTVLLKPLPYGDPDRLVTIVESDARTLNPETVSFATVEDWRHRARSFDRLSLWSDFGVRPLRDGRAEELRGMRVSVDFFDTLGIPMFLGRPFTADDDTVAGRRVVIISFGTWMDRFGGDAAIVGREMPTVEGSFTIVGVLPADFHPLHMSNPAELPRVFLPLGPDVERDPGRSGPSRRLRLIGRLKPGVTARRAQSELNTVMRRLVDEYPEYPSDASAIVTPLRDQLLGGFGTPLGMLQAAALVLLVLACANVAVLLLARMVGRQHEMAIRAALGADRSALIRQLLTECALIAAMGAAIGVSLAWMATRIVARTGDPNIPRIGELVPDSSMLLVGIAAAVVTTLLFGLGPAAMQSGGSLAGSRSGQNVLGRRSHHAFVRALSGGELALAFVLVLTVGLLSKSYLRLMQVDPGFHPKRILTLSLLPDGVHYQTPVQRQRYFDAVVDRMRSIPGVEAVGYASTLPLSRPSTGAVYIREHPITSERDAPSLDTYLVSPQYLEVMRIPILQGRGFTESDGPSAERVAIVSESMARAELRDENPLGLHVRIDSRADRDGWAVIVGVVGDVHQYGLDLKPDAAVYLPLAQVDHPSQGWTSLVVRSTPPPEQMLSAVDNAMKAVDPLQPVFHLQPMTAYIALSVSQRTFILWLMAAIGVLALVMATAGAYSVVSYTVAQRTREVGLRLALGATSAAVLWMLARQVLLVASVGVLTGWVLAAWLTNGLSALLFSIGRFDIETTCGVACMLIAAALAAGVGPIARVSGLDPMVALRSE